MQAVYFILELTLYLLLDGFHSCPKYHFLGVTVTVMVTGLRKELRGRKRLIGVARTVSQGEKAGVYHTMFRRRNTKS
jgi:hypothetical protein